MQKECRICGKLIVRQRNEDAGNFKRKTCCSKECRDKAQSITSKGITRSPKNLIKKGQRIGINTEFKWKKGKVVNVQGYEMEFIKDHPFKNATGYVLKHRLVMEKKIGRYLTENEVVHHIDGDRLNNDIDNLMLFASSGEHSKHHQQIKKCGL